MTPRQNTEPLVPAWFFRFFSILAAASVLMLGILYFDFFSNPLAPDPSWGSVGNRLFTALVLTPVGLIISVLVLRRTTRNITGLLLIMYAASAMRTIVPIDSPLQAQPILQIFFRIADQGVWLLPLYFPDGQPYPLRFGRWLRVHSVLMVLFYIGRVVFYPTVQAIPGIPQTVFGANPVYIPALLPIQDLFTLIQSWLWLSSVVFIVPSVILRYRGSRGIVRQQIKWFVWWFALLISIFIVLAPQFVASSSGKLNPDDFGVLGIFIILYQAVLVPITPFFAVGYAILRHRLYDIDIIIRRTVIYAILSTLLALVFFGSVTLVQQVFRVATGQNSDLAIVVSTLVIAALFSPLRQRVQNGIDRRLYRRKYDTEKTLARFSQTLQNETNLESLQVSMIGVVQETMQPNKIGLWLREKRQ